jgi:hypothetical protein
VLGRCARDEVQELPLAVADIERHRQLRMAGRELLHELGDDVLGRRGDRRASQLACGGTRRLAGGRLN